MGFGISNLFFDMRYVLFTVLLMFSTFEFFFREKRLELFLLSLIAVITILKNKDLPKPSMFIMVISLLFFLLRSVYLGSILIGFPCVMMGTLSVALILKEDFVEVFIKTMVVICVYSIFIYILWYIPKLGHWMMYDLCSHFTSLNSQIAVVKGGGLNFVVYNFQQDLVYLISGLRRNCGPFWEPGQFAVYISLALCFNLYLHEVNRKYNILFTLALITTLSTGGFLTGIILLLGYFWKDNSSALIKMTGTLVSIIALYYISQLDFIGEKTLNQIHNSEVGSDSSRFGAMLTQLKMIANSPFFGGEDMQNYVLKKGGTLASGTLLPFVNYGILYGTLLYFLLYKSIVRLCNHYSCPRINGLLMFIIILSLSVSQTILFNSIFLVLIFVGLNCSTQTNIQSYERV